MGGFGHSNPETIRESHAILSDVMSGRVTPRCQRAQRAHRVATRFPLSALDAELDGAWTPQTLAPSRPPSPPAPSPVQDLMLDVVFGSMAPQARAVTRFLGTPRGTGVLLVGGVALASLLAPRVMP